MSEQNEVCLIAPSSSSDPNLTVYTAKFPLKLCINCCSTIERFAEVHHAFGTVLRNRREENDAHHEHNAENAVNETAAVEEQQRTPSSNNNNRRSASSSAIPTSGRKSSKRSRSETSAIKKKKTNKFRLDVDTDSFSASALPPSFFSELPSVLQMELPTDTDIETLQLYSEFHCGGSYFNQTVTSSSSSNSSSSSHRQQNSDSRNENVIIKSLELNEVTNWGTEHEESKSWREAAAKYFGAVTNPLLQQNVSKKKNPTKRYQNPAAEFVTDEEVVEHGNVSPFALQDRNPSVILSSCSRFQHSNENENQNNNNIDDAKGGSVPDTSSGTASTKNNQNISSASSSSSSSSSSILPLWEQKWVQENFLSCASPACCAKAARLAALAEFLGCDQLIQLCAVIIAARLSERGAHGSTEHMQWCLMGKSSNLGTEM